MKRNLGLIDILGNELRSTKTNNISESDELRSNIDQYWMNSSDITSDLLKFAEKAKEVGGAKLLGQIQLSLRKALIKIGKMRSQMIAVQDQDNGVEDTEE